MQKILLTGGSGFIGQALAKRLADDGYEIHAMLQNNSHVSKIAPGISVHIADLMDFYKVEKLIARIQPEFVIHLAAKTEVELSFANYIDVSKVNYVGTVNLVEANRKFNPNLKLFMMASTMETYGHQAKDNGPFTEATIQKPMAPYAVAKLACEKYLQYMEYAYQFPFVAFRQTNAYGRHDNDFFVVERIITQMISNPEICELGDPDPWRNFLFIDDLVDLYSLVMRNIDKVKGQFFVTGPDNAIPIHQLADLIKEKLNWRGEIRWHTKPKRVGEIYYLNSNPAKAKEILGWEPKVDLSEGLDRTIAIWQGVLNAGKTKQVRPEQSPVSPEQTGPATEPSPGSVRPDEEVEAIKQN